MQTLVVRIGEPARPGEGFPVTLLAGASCDASDLAPVPNATALIPSTLAPDAPVRLGDDGEGEVLTAARVRELYDDGAETSDDYLAIGEFLYRLLARGPLGDAWAAQRANAGEAAPLRTLLDIGTGAALRPLHALPWELTYDPASAAHLFLEPWQPMLRAAPITRAGARQPPPADDWPLRVLVVFAAEPDGEPEAGAANGGIQARAELHALETLFATSRFDVEYELLEYPMPERIVAACERIQPHVLHFIGHGEGGGDARTTALQIYRPAAPGTNDGPEYVPWPLLDIRTGLRGFAPRFAFINACRSADAATRAAPAPMASIADAFLQLPGTLGVVGMQGDIPGDVAGDFARAFYEAALAGRPVDEAVLAARRLIANRRRNIARRREWSLPMLRTTVCPELVLPRRPGAACTASLVERFVARVSQRRLVREAVRSTAAAGAEASPHLVVIVGDEDVGKSHLAKWCAQICEWRGHHTVYVTFGNASVDVLDALRWIRDGRRPERGRLPERVSNWGLPAEAFRRFNWELNQRKRGLTAIPPLPETGDVFDEGTALTEGAAPPETLVGDTVRQFCLALEAAAGDRPLVLVLDQIEGLDETTLTEWLPKYLFMPVAAGAVKNVRIVLVVRRGDFERRLARLRQTVPAPTVVAVDLFAREEFDSVARYLCLQWSEQTYLDARDTLPVLLRKFGRPNGWGGLVLRSVEDMCRIFNA